MEKKQKVEVKNQASKKAKAKEDEVEIEEDDDEMESDSEIDQKQQKNTESKRVSETKKNNKKNEGTDEKPKKGKKPGVVDPETSSLDMSAWNRFFLPSEVLDGLRKMRYTEPTEIQEKVLPEAILKRLDILGAAETVSVLLFISI